MHNLIFCVIRHNIKGVKKKTISQEKLFKYLNYVFSIIIFSVLFLASFLQAFSVYYIIYIFIFYIPPYFVSVFIVKPAAFFIMKIKKTLPKPFLFLLCLFAVWLLEKLWILCWHLIKKNIVQIKFALLFNCQETNLGSMKC